MDEIMMITDFVQEEAGAGTDVIWGNCYNEDLGDNLSVTLIATGFKSHGAANRIDDEGRIIQKLDDEQTREFISPQRLTLEDVTGESLNYAGSKTTSWEPSTHRPISPRPSVTPASPMQRQHQGGAPVKLSSPKVISDLENEPAFARRGIRLDDTSVPSSEETRSRISVNDSDEPDLFNTLPYLHDKGTID